MVEYESVYCSETSAVIGTPEAFAFSPSKWMIGESGFLFVLRYEMNSSMPPS